MAAALQIFPLQSPVAIFLCVLVIILLAPLIFRAMRIPNIIGLIIAGMIVGPNGCGLLARDASFEIFGQVGILYLMFLAAAEIDMLDLRKNARKGILLGLLTFALPMGIGLVASRYAFGIGWLPATLIASMYASHTLVSYPIISRFGLQNSRSVVIAVSATVIAVLLALLVLAETVAINESGRFAWSGLALLLGLMVAYSAAISLLYPLLTRWFFRKVADPVSQFIFIMALVLFAALLAQLIGLEAILGAFFAGLVLNPFIPTRSALMRRIEFVGNAIFIPYFLIGVGMLINVRVLFDGWTVARIALIMSAIALSSKWLAALVAQKIFGMTADGRMLMFGLTSGKAAATVAATMLGYRYGLIGEDLMNGAVVMILICCAVSSITTQRAAMRRRMHIEEAEMRPDRQEGVRAARQLVAVSNPLTAEGIMKLATLMRHPSNHLPVTALFVRKDDSPETRAIGRDALRLATESALAADIKVKEVERFDINVAAGITAVAKENDASDIIIGLHRKSNIVDTFYGSMIDSLLGATNKCVIMSRCFIPVNTVRSIMVIVPPRAEYETGFSDWVGRVSNLASQLGRRLNFLAAPATIPYIQGVITAEKYPVHTHYEELRTWDDFIIFSNLIIEDDLMVVIGARRTSISFDNDLAQLPPFLGKYFKRQNLMVVYPEQFGATAEMPAPIDPLTQRVSTAPSTLPFSLQRIRSAYAALRLELRRHRARRSRHRRL